MKYDYLFINEFHSNMIKITELRSKGNEIEIKHKIIYLIRAFSDLFQTNFGISSIRDNGYIFPIMDYVAHMRNIFRSLNKDIQNEIISSVDNIYYVFKIKFIPSEFIELDRMNLKCSALRRDVLYEYILDGNYDIPNSKLLSKTVRGSFFERSKVNVAKRLLYSHNFVASSNSINVHKEVYFLYIHDNTFSDLSDLSIFTDIEERSNSLLFNRENI